jgi:hypothetical protein
MTPTNRIITKLETTVARKLGVPAVRLVRQDVVHGQRTSVYAVPAHVAEQAEALGLRIDRTATIGGQS